METPQAHPRVSQGVRRRDLLKAGLATGVTLAGRCTTLRHSGGPKRGHPSAAASSVWPGMIPSTLTPISRLASRPIPR